MVMSKSTGLIVLIVLAFAAYGVSAQEKQSYIGCVCPSGVSDSQIFYCLCPAKSTSGKYELSKGSESNLKILLEALGSASPGKYCVESSSGEPKHVDEGLPLPWPFPWSRACSQNQGLTSARVRVTTGNTE
jgi:hypothetical protein